MGTFTCIWIQMRNQFPGMAPPLTANGPSVAYQMTFNWVSEYDTEERESVKILTQKFTVTFILLFLAFSIKENENKIWVLDSYNQ